MRHRIFTPEPFPPGAVVEVTGEELHHALRVVRLRDGEAVELFDGRGSGAAGTVQSIESGRLLVRAGEEIGGRESPLRLRLAMAIIQLEKFELVLQKATELGVSAIVPVVTDRVEVRAERYRGKSERWEKIVLEAVKQSGRTALPTLEPPARFDDLVAAPGIRIVFDAEAAVGPVLQAGESAATLFIGPEGGLSERELELARAAGSRFARLGPRRLRAETAAIAACAVTAATHGDLRW